jgi:Rrf2 family protein
MWMSRAAQVAMQASMLLALEPYGKLIRVRDLAARLDIPAPYLSQVCHQLVKAGVLRSAKGPTGGFGLLKPARDIVVSDVVCALDGELVIDSSVFGFARPAAGENAFDSRWRDVRTTARTRLFNRPLSDVARELSAYLQPTE